MTFEADEDLPHLLQHLGEDALMMSTDYPHGDMSADERFVDKLMMRQDISASLKEKAHRRERRSVLPRLGGQGPAENPPPGGSEKP